MRNKLFITLLLLSLFSSCSKQEEEEEVEKLNIEANFEDRWSDTIYIK